jgi:hypothetical protein
MSDERRYTDDEVAEIIQAASTPVVPREEPADPASPRGLTLAELQEIAREVGIPPDRIAQAAAALDRRQPPLPRRTDFGMPVSASHIVEIPRPLTDREWSFVLADLRETFRAWGNEGSQGETRMWWNNNLHAIVEPTQTGYRLRLGTLKADGFAMNRVGMVAIAMSIVVAFALGGDTAGLPPMLAIASMGAGAIAFNALRLPRWARLRERQMQEIAERTLALLGSAPSSTPTEAR